MSQGKRGPGCELIDGEEPIDASHYVPPDICQNGLMARKIKIPGRGQFVVVLENPGVSAVRICRRTTAEGARQEAKRLNDELRAQQPTGKRPAFYYVLSVSGGLPWLPTFALAADEKPTRRLPVQATSRKTTARAT